MCYMYLPGPLNHHWTGSAPEQDSLLTVLLAQGLKHIQ